ncbi:uncharacterized protein TRIADDRAFT_60990 [Trichoplax adhaerens]|uniref:DNA repair nuclease/redox regulator APEX1 n=1 Tax=Trichoplax adhaerens TaxID=10228 RepID=B3S9Q4_TRIAD|nr:hypothetical protein TRIADDRAFT_60990 [Trichoplax adhaerens]EDV20576.1 hypothetical protein TRIADDRAFT_60990 [Trichoplax adhaerens]|eukprot:XP_002117002.1 hypothetical protein TRIADDRAFT_60990 [Trichoplax adhaerens]
MPKRKASVTAVGKAKKQAKKAADSSKAKGGKSSAVDKEPTVEIKHDQSSVEKENQSHGKSSSNWNTKITSWNVNGIKAWFKKNGHSYLTDSNIDIICLQETKCAESEIPNEIKLDGYHTYFYSAEQKGYSSTGLLSKVKPLKVTFGITNIILHIKFRTDIEKHDKEGRVITAEYDKFFLVGAYLANPKTNTKTAGFTKEEREGFGKLLDCGFIDTFRHFYPNKTSAYSFWSYMSNARSKNIGWRLDYFVTSKNLIPNVADSIIRSEIEGSDHCPIELLLQI